jgi:hypothetical protein
MYRDSPQGLRMIDYINEIRGFINYTLSNPRNISEGILDVHAKGVKIKSFSML